MQSDEINRVSLRKKLVSRKNAQKFLFFHLKFSLRLGHNGLRLGVIGGYSMEDRFPSYYC